MFANYNLIAAMSLLLPVAKYTSKYALYCISMRWTWSYYLFHTGTNRFTMEWLPMIGVGIGKYPFCTLCDVIRFYLSTKWAITWEFLTLYRNPQLVAASILVF
jgi:hypothetical protein